MTLELLDLSTYGIHFNNPGDRCCQEACGHGSVRGWGEALFADELCERCYMMPTKVGGKIVRVSRRRLFYRHGTVLVMLPTDVRRTMLKLWGHLPQPPRQPGSYSCLVKIDGQLYFGCRELGAIALERQDGLRREHGLQLTQKRLGQLYVEQRTRAKG